MLGKSEAAVNSGHHGGGRAKIGAQCVVPAKGGLPGGQIGKDVGAAKRIDRLLGITDHQQAAIGSLLSDPVDAFENPVLHRIGILKLIDQGYRVLPTQGLRQLGAGRTVQRRV